MSTLEERPESSVAVTAETEQDDWGAWAHYKNKALSPRYKEIARLIFLGKTNQEIAKVIGITENRISIIRTNPKIKEEVTRLQEQIFERTAQDRIRDMAPAAANILDHILNTDDPEVKIALKQQTAVWVLEKITGKPKQEVNVESNTIMEMMDMMKQMRDSGQQALPPPVLDITPHPTLSDGSKPERLEDIKTEAERWVNENL